MNTNPTNSISDIREQIGVDSRGGGGFTILELVVGIGLFLVLSAGFLSLTLLYANSGRLLPGARLSVDVRRLHQTTLEDMLREVRAARSILATTSISSVTYTTGTTTLALKVRSFDASGDIIPGSFDAVVYYTNTTTPPIPLHKAVAAASGSQRKAAHGVLNGSVSNISFTYNSSTPSYATKIEVRLKTAKTIGSLTESASSTVELTLR